MEEKNFYKLQPLPYGYNELEPSISEEQLTLHHDRHHKAYVDGANAILQKLDSSRQSGEQLDMKSTLKELSFNIGGHVLHSLFWKNLTPEGTKPSDFLSALIHTQFGSFENFEKEFSETAIKTEGSGWAALTYDERTERLIISQIEKHNVNMFPILPIILVLDVWEHAYYLDYKNERAKYVEAFWNIVDWEEVERRIKEAQKLI